MNDQFANLGGLAYLGNGGLNYLGNPGLAYLGNDPYGYMSPLGAAPQEGVHQAVRIGTGAAVGLLAFNMIPAIVPDMGTSVDFGVAVAAAVGGWFAGTALGDMLFQQVSGFLPGA